ncbi:MAG: hypothetical protein JO336_02895 [Acidobacteriia bacterium]|nr:hypothetical protein [Terriglobia bacterium]MBV8904833.1 hypothetical protein [Terriglobia bacterium]
MTRKLVNSLSLMTLGFLTICAPIVAHHGTAGVYDYTHRITTKATVTQYIWANPHVQIYFTLKNDKGEEQTWGVETASPGNMLASGWTKRTFKPGDEILVSFVPAKNDRPFGICPRFVLPDGTVLGGSRCNLGGGGVVVSTLSVKPGYTTVEVQMPPDDNKRPPSEQEQ